MLNGDVNAVGLATSLILVGIALAVSITQQLRLEKQLVWATARAFVQLIIMGFVLAWMLEPGRSTAYAWAWVAGMVVFAGWTVRNRAPRGSRTVTDRNNSNGGGNRGNDGRPIWSWHLPDGSQSHCPPRRHDDRQFAERNRSCGAAGH